jgi:hypothetical protein
MSDREREEGEEKEKKKEKKRKETFVVRQSTTASGKLGKYTSLAAVHAKLRPYGVGDVPVFKNFSFTSATGWSGPNGRGGGLTAIIHSVTSA